jgi:tetratricopeptide (TPR) repeat protein
VHNCCEAQNYWDIFAYYKKSLELKPDNAIVNGNYAFFLTNIRENHDQTEAYYKKALKLEPKRMHNCCEAQNYWDIFSVLFGIFHLSYQDLSLLYNANINGNYALFLTKIHKKHDQAEKHYKKALELDPDHANNCLHDQDQVLGLFYNAFLLGRAFCESSLKRVHNCH